MSKKSWKTEPHDHGPPVTRRDFISRGLIQGGGMLLAPSILGALLKSQLAEAALTCPSSAGTPGLVPFLSIDCAGGAALSGNAAVGSQTSGALTLLPSYNTLGITYDPASTPGSIDGRFGMPFHAGPSPADSARPISKIFEGIIKSSSATTQANTRIVGICHESQDDSRNNELNPIIAVSKSGLVGKYFRSGIGTSNSASGGNSAPSLLEGALQPMYAGSVDNIIQALNYGQTVQNYTPAKKAAMANAISGLSQAQAAKFAALPANEQFQTLVNCGLASNVPLATASPAVDPRQNTVMQAVYGITTTSNSYEALNAGIVYNVLMGNSGPGTITEYGCDYHNNVEPTDPQHGDVTDYRIGQQIGRAIEAAARLGKPLFIAVFSDGSVSSDPGTRKWPGDAGSKSLALMVYYKPGIANNRNSQLGSYTTGQAANGTPFFARNAKFVSYVMLANYLAVSGQLGLFANLAPTGFPTDTATLDSIRGFG
jgi:hypothetical protein